MPRITLTHVLSGLAILVFLCHIKDVFYLVLNCMYLLKTMSLDIEFQKAVQKVCNAPAVNPPSDEVRLDFYAYFKQATQGDVQDEPPSRVWFKARAKWNAWNSLKGMSKAQAKVNYIKLTNSYEI